MTQSRKALGASIQVPTSVDAEATSPQVSDGPVDPVIADKAPAREPIGGADGEEGLDPRVEVFNKPAPVTVPTVAPPTVMRPGIIRTDSTAPLPVTPLKPSYTFPEKASVTDVTSNGFKRETY